MSVSETSLEIIHLLKTEFELKSLRDRKSLASEDINKKRASK
jgi:hypothetical protein